MRTKRAMSSLRLSATHLEEGPCEETHFGKMPLRALSYHTVQVHTVVHNTHAHKALIFMYMREQQQQPTTHKPPRTLCSFIHQFIHVRNSTPGALGGSHRDRPTDRCDERNTRDDNNRECFGPRKRAYDMVFACVRVSPFTTIRLRCLRIIARVKYTLGLALD